MKTAPGAETYLMESDEMTQRRQADLIEQLVSDTIAWQHQTGLQRLPSQASTASREEDGLA